MIRSTLSARRKLSLSLHDLIYAATEDGEEETCLQAESQNRVYQLQVRIHSSLPRNLAILIPSSCRRSHTKCDEKKPHCSRCTTLHRHCSYPVQPVLKTKLSSSTASPAPSPSPPKHSPEPSEFYDSAISTNGGDGEVLPNQQQVQEEMGDLSTRLRRGLLRVAPIPANPNRIFCIGNDFGKHANNSMWTPVL